MYNLLQIKIQNKKQKNWNYKNETKTNEFVLFYLSFRQNFFFFGGGGQYQKGIKILQMFTKNIFVYWKLNSIK